MYIFRLVHQDWRLALQSYFLHQRLVANCKDSFSLLYLCLWFCRSCWSHNLVRKIIFTLVLSLIPTINSDAAMSWLSSPYPQNKLKFWSSVRTCFVILVFVICPSFWFQMLIIYLFHYDFIFPLFSFSISLSFPR